MKIAYLFGHLQVHHTPRHAGKNQLFQLPVKRRVPENMADHYPAARALCAGQQFVRLRLVQGERLLQQHVVPRV